MNHERHDGSVVTLAALLVVGLIGSACTNTETVTASSPDGMVAVQGLRADEAWAKPGLDLAGYDKLLLAPTEFEFRDVPKTAGYYGRANSTVTEFPVSENDRKQLTETVARVLREELSQSRSFTLTEEPGPGVLVVRTALEDIISRVPPEIPAQRRYLDRIARTGGQRRRRREP